MAQERRAEIVKNLIRDGRLKEFQDIFLYITKTEMASHLGINYTRFRGLINNPKPLRYSETIAIAKALDVSPRAISMLIHNQLEAKTPKKRS